MSERPTEALRAEFRRCRSSPAFAVVNGDRHDAACDALDATVADLERDLAVSRAEAQAYLARIEADTTHISKLTAEVGRLRKVVEEIATDDITLSERHGSGTSQMGSLRKHIACAALTPPADQPAPKEPPKPEQRVMRPEWLDTPESELATPTRAPALHLRRYALQLERATAALTAEVGRLREALAKSESAPKVSTTPIEEEAFPFPPADQPAPEDER